MQPLGSSRPTCRAQGSGACGGGDVRPSRGPPRLRGRERPGPPGSPGPRCRVGADDQLRAMWGAGSLVGPEAPPPGSWGSRVQQRFRGAPPLGTNVHSCEPSPLLWQLLFFFSRTAVDRCAKRAVGRGDPSPDRVLAWSRRQLFKTRTCRHPPPPPGPGPAAVGTPRVRAQGTWRPAPRSARHTLFVGNSHPFLFLE